MYRLVYEHCGTACKRANNYVILLLCQKSNTNFNRVSMPDQESMFRKLLLIIELLISTLFLKYLDIGVLQFHAVNIVSSFYIHIKKKIGHGARLKKTRMSNPSHSQLIFLQQRFLLNILF